MAHALVHTRLRTHGITRLQTHSAARRLGADEALERARRAYEARGAGAAWSSAVTEQQREAVRRFLAGAKA